MWAMSRMRRTVSMAALYVVRRVVQRPVAVKCW